MAREVELDEEEESWRRIYRPELETPRFHLRPLIVEDVDWLAALYMDTEVTRFLWDDACSLEKARKGAEAVIYLDRIKWRAGCWAIIDKVSGDVHGWVELSKLRPYIGGSDEIALSYVLRRASWGQGIATEAGARMLRHGFEVLELDQILAVIKVENAASRRVLEKLGMYRLTRENLSDWPELQFFQIDAPQIDAPKSVG